MLRLLLLLLLSRLVLLCSWRLLHGREERRAGGLRQGRPNRRQLSGQRLGRMADGLHGRNTAPPPTRSCVLACLLCRCCWDCLLLLMAA